MKRLLFLLLLPLLTPPFVLADPGGGSAPATLTKEGDLVIITLTPEAEQRLRLKTVAVEKRRVPDARLLAGEVVIPLGQEGKAVAPVLGGTLDEVLRLADLQAAADGRVRQAQVQIDAAKIAVERAERVLKAEAGSVRAVDEAKSGLALAEAERETAQAQRDLLGAAVGEDADARRVWVRVSIYTGEAERLDDAAAALVRPLSAESGGQTALRVAGPPTANALTNSVDWYYQPQGGNWRAGERVAVEIPAKEASVEHEVIPLRAVLQDIHGGQWVYVDAGDHHYRRLRVQVLRVANDVAVLAGGPAVGTKVVTDGATELFGTEFMTGK